MNTTVLDAASPVSVRRIGIIGAGNTGLAMAAHMASCGLLPMVYTRQTRKAEALRAHPLHATGVLSGDYHIEATTDMRALVEGNDCLVIATWANAHHAVAQSIADAALLLHGKALPPILVLNGNWGAYELFDLLHGNAATADSPIAESAGMPYVAQLLLPGNDTDGSITGATDGGASGTDPECGLTVNIGGIKDTTTVAYAGAYSAEHHPALDDMLCTLYRDVRYEDSIFTTSLTAPNPIIHAPLCLLNLARIENGERFHLLTSGFTERTEQLVRAIDHERHALAQHLGVPYTPILDQLNGFWDAHYPSLRELFTKHKVYASLWAPDTINHRFIQEDVPYGLAPLVHLGHELGVPTPTCDALLSIYRTYLGLGDEGPQFTTRLLHQLR